jgi:hypothetical protein
MTTWKFKPYTEDDTRENPTQSQFFTTDVVEGISNGLIREGIQNALDAQLDKTKPVKIKITLVDYANGLKPNSYKKYIAGLDEHLRSADSGIRNIPDLFNEAMGYLVFEDFNTEGLQGNPDESKDIEINDRSRKHHFYYFWRNVGITGKAEDTLGKWGIGKTVFPASSRINTFWGLTIQSDSKEELLLGQSILRKHNLESDSREWGYRPYGYFGNFSESSFFAKPILDKAFLNDFKKDFKLKRIDEPGLSIVVPFYKVEISRDLVIYAVIKQYFFPILSNNLSVEIISNGDVLILNNDNIINAINEIKTPQYSDDEERVLFDKDALLSLFDFTKWAINLSESSYNNLKSPKPENQPMWKEELWADLDFETLINNFENNNRIAFKVPVKYQKKENGQPPKICWFKIFLEKDEKLKIPEDHFIRENITIIHVKSLESPSVRGIALFDDKDLSNLLGDSENPAHTEWQKDSQNFTNKYTHGDKCIQFITRSIQKVYSKLQRPAVGLDKEILKDIFFVETKEDDIRPLEPDDDSKKDEEIIKPELTLTPSKKVRILVKKNEGGFTLYTKNTDVASIDNISVRLAYVTTRGKPLAKYSEYDFELNKKPIIIKNKKCEVLSCKKNSLMFSTKSADFEMTLDGFDINRDLFVKVDIKNKEDDSEI